MIKNLFLLFIYLLTLLLVFQATAQAHPEHEHQSESFNPTEPSSKRTPPFDIVLIPGFASTQLIAWRGGKGPCAGTLGMSPGSRAWVNVAQMVASPACWLECMMLDLDQNDLPYSCRARPGEGLSAVTVLDPGLITGPLSAVWADFFTTFSLLWDYDPQSLTSFNYDFRLAPCLLASRDNYWQRLKAHIESHQRPVAILAHSLGNNVFRYFLAWLQRQLAPDAAQAWIDRHIVIYFALGAPILGAVEPLKAVLEGITFGLPISAPTARKLTASFSSGPWMLPFLSPQRFSPNATAWPHPLILSLSGVSPGDPETAPFTFDHMDPVAAGQLDYGPEDMQLLIQLLGAKDAVAGVGLSHFYKKFYEQDPLVDLSAPWARPPIKHVFAVYGRNNPTDVHYHYQKPPALYTQSYPETSWVRLATTMELPNAIVRKDHYTGAQTVLSHTQGSRSGDGVVPYASLAWTHTWLGQNASAVNVTSISQNYYDLALEPYLPPNARADHPSGSITFYEAADPLSGQTTAVWEIDHAIHRGIIVDSSFLREFSHFLDHFAQHPEQPFPSKEARRPLHDDSCFWDYPAVRCALPQFCEYQYRFGDLTLDMSCRLKKKQNLMDASKTNMDDILKSDIQL